MIDVGLVNCERTSRGTVDLTADEKADISKHFSFEEPVDVDNAVRVAHIVKPLKKERTFEVRNSYLSPHALNFIRSD